MLKKVYKKIEQDNGTITFYGSNRAIKLHYGIPEWRKDPSHSCYNEEDQYFMYRGRKYWLDEFMTCRDQGMPEYMKEFDGYLNDSFFSGIVIKFCESMFGDNDCVKAYTFIS